MFRGSREGNWCLAAVLTGNESIVVIVNQNVMEITKRSYKQNGADDPTTSQMKSHIMYYSVLFKVVIFYNLGVM